MQNEVVVTPGSISLRGRSANATFVIANPSRSVVAFQIDVSKRDIIVSSQHDYINPNSDLPIDVYISPSSINTGSSTENVQVKVLFLPEDFQIKIPAEDTYANYCNQFPSQTCNVTLYISYEMPKLSPLSSGSSLISIFDNGLRDSGSSFLDSDVINRLRSTSADNAAIAPVIGIAARGGTKHIDVLKQVQSSVYGQAHTDVLRHLHHEHIKADSDHIIRTDLEGRVLDLLVKNVTKGDPLTTTEMNELKTIRGRLSKEQWNMWLALAREEKKRREARAAVEIERRIASEQSRVKGSATKVLQNKAENSDNIIYMQPTADNVLNLHPHLSSSSSSPGKSTSSLLPEPAQSRSKDIVASNAAANFSANNDSSNSSCSGEGRGVAIMSRRSASPIIDANTFLPSTSGSGSGSGRNTQRVRVSMDPNHPILTSGDLMAENSDNLMVNNDSEASFNMKSSSSSSSITPVSSKVVLSGNNNSDASGNCSNINISNDNNRNTAYFSPIPPKVNSGVKGGGVQSHIEVAQHYTLQVGDGDDSSSESGESSGVTSNNKFNENYNNNYNNIIDNGGDDINDDYNNERNGYNNIDVYEDEDEDTVDQSSDGSISAGFIGNSGAATSTVSDEGFRGVEVSSLNLSGKGSKFVIQYARSSPNSTSRLQSPPSPPPSQSYEAGNTANSNLNINLNTQSTAASSINNANVDLSSSSLSAKKEIVVDRGPRDYKTMLWSSNSNSKSKSGTTLQGDSRNYRPANSDPISNISNLPNPSKSPEKIDQIQKIARNSQVRIDSAVTSAKCVLASLNDNKLTEANAKSTASIIEQMMIALEKSKTQMDQLQAITTSMIVENNSDLRQISSATSDGYTNQFQPQQINDNVFYEDQQSYSRSDFAPRSVSKGGGGGGSVSQSSTPRHNFTNIGTHGHSSVIKSAPILVTHANFQHAAQVMNFHNQTYPIVQAASAQKFNPHSTSHRSIPAGRVSFDQAAVSSNSIHQHTNNNSNNNNNNSNSINSASKGFAGTVDRGDREAYSDNSNNNGSVGASYNKSVISASQSIGYNVNRERLSSSGGGGSGDPMGVHGFIWNGQRYNEVQSSISNICIASGPLVKAFEEFPIRIDMESSSLDLVWREMRQSGLGASLGASLGATSTTLRRERFVFDDIFAGPASGKRLSAYCRQRTKRAMFMGKNLVFMAVGCGDASVRGQMEPTVQSFLGQSGGQGVVSDCLDEMFRVLTPYTQQAISNNSHGGPVPHNTFVSTKIQYEQENVHIHLSSVIISGTGHITDILRNRSHSNAPKCYMGRDSEGNSAIMNCNQISLKSILDYERVVGVILGRRSAFREIIQNSGGGGVNHGKLSKDDMQWIVGDTPTTLWVTVSVQGGNLVTNNGGNSLYKGSMQMHFVCPCGDKWGAPGPEVCLLAEGISSIPHAPTPTMLKHCPLVASILDTEVKRCNTDFINVATINRDANGGGDDGGRDHRTMIGEALLSLRVISNLSN